MQYFNIYIVLQINVSKFEVHQQLLQQYQTMSWPYKLEANVYNLARQPPGKAYNSVLPSVLFMIKMF